MAGAFNAAFGMGNLAKTTADKMAMAEAGEAASDALAWKQMEVAANKKGNEIAGNSI